MPGTATRRAAKAAPAPVVEPDEDEFEEMEDDAEDDGLEDVEDEAVEEAPAPKAKRRGNPEALAKAQAARAATAPKFGSNELAAHVTEATGETYDARGVRMLLRKLATDGKLPRVIGETRDRYSFSGPEDPTVVAVVAMIKDGTAKKLKQAGLEKVKAQADAKKAAAKAAKAKAEAEPDEDDEFEDAEDEVEEAPAPKPRARRAAPAKAAPAKAAPRKATARAKA